MPRDEAAAVDSGAVIDISAVTEQRISSVADLIELEEELSFYTHFDWCFRGQPRTYGNLMPSFQRQFAREAVGAAAIIEGRLMSAFREHYTKLPDRSEEMPQPEHITSGFDLRCLSMMQHYEIPTRLLDWSSSIWTSSYFACVSEPSKDAELWFYDRHLFDDQRAGGSQFYSLLSTQSPPLPEASVLSEREAGLILELDPRISPRMVQQVAHHTVSTEIFSDHAPLLYDKQHDLNYLELHGVRGLRRKVIDASCKGKVLQFLAESKNITASTIFPDVVGLGRFLRSQLDSLRTMMF
ncbi:MAG: FRG domain-containing protein [Pseudomonadota bacterium]